MSEREAKMTRHDYQELAKFIRAQERVLKTSAKQREEELRADFEQQLAAVYKRDDERWASINEEAEKAVAGADAKIALICREQGIPEQFRPELRLMWYGRGENAFKERRAELRRVAEGRIAAIGQRAKAEIERRCLASQEKLLRGGLESDEASALLDSLPVVEELMPRLSLTEVEAARPIRGTTADVLKELTAQIPADATPNAEDIQKMAEILAIQNEARSE